MKHYSIKEIEKAVAAILGEHPDNYSDFVIKVSDLDDQYLIDISDMYDSPKISWKEMKALAEFFETDNIDFHDDYGYTGCETCGYGGEHGKIIRVWEG